MAIGSAPEGWLEGAMDGCSVSAGVFISGGVVSSGVEKVGIKCESLVLASATLRYRVRGQALQ